MNPSSPAFSGNPEHLGVLLRAVEQCDISIWNNWRMTNPAIRPALTGVALEGAVLFEANLAEANLGNANLRGCQLMGADLRGAVLVGADLDGANLFGANCLGADFSNGSLRGATLRCAMQGCTFEGANLDDADLMGADFSGARLAGALLRNAKAFGTRFRNAILASADLTGINLGNADLLKAECDNALFSDASLLGAMFSEASLRNAAFCRADLTNAFLDRTILAGADLSGAKLTNANLMDADLRNAIFRGTNLQGTVLMGAALSGNDLSNVNLSLANLAMADLSEANLTDANLTGVMMVGTDLRRATLKGCWVFGISPWEVLTEGADQQDLVVSKPSQPRVTVDDIEMAQFIYLLLNNTRIRQVVDTVTSKIVLILGRFTSERKMVLDAVRDHLRARNYVPVLFDFDRPTHLDEVETVTLLARMARFIIADLTEPHCVPDELRAIVPDVEVPVIPIIERDTPYATFGTLRKYDWLLDVVRYQGIDDLLASFDNSIISRAENMSRKLEERKARRDNH